VRLVHGDEELAALVARWLEKPVLGADCETYAPPEEVERLLAEALAAHAAARTPTGRPKKPKTPDEVEKMRARIRKNIATDPLRAKLRLVQIAVPGDAVYVIDARRCVGGALPAPGDRQDGAGERL
jgi:hypothetical protein